VEQTACLLGAFNEVAIEMKAVWQGQIIAQSEDAIMVESNHYFPISSIKSNFFKPSNTTSHCPWKGEASYFSIEVAGKLNKDAAWFYKTPKKAAKEIAGRVAFWKGVQVVK